MTCGNKIVQPQPVVGEALCSFTGSPPVDTGDLKHSGGWEIYGIGADHMETTKNVSNMHRTILWGSGMRRPLTPLGRDHGSD